MGMSDELARRMDKRSKEEKKEIISQMMAEKIPTAGQGDHEKKRGMMARVWGVIRKWIGLRNPR